MSVAFWNARKKQKRNPRLEFQLKDPDTFLFKTRYITDQSPLASFTKITRCNYEITKEQLPEVLTIAAKTGYEVVPIPDYIEKALEFDLNMPFDETFKEIEIWKKMFQYQRDGVHTVITKFDGRCIIGDSMGLGKTLQALAICKYYKHKRVLVVCPAYLRLNWKHEIHKWIGEHVNVMVISKGSEDIPDEDGYLITSYELATKKQDDLKKLKYDIAVVDESHYLKSFKSKRTKKLTPVLKKMKHCLLLTGTPCLNRSCELYTQTHIVRKEFFPKWRPYTKRYCNGNLSMLGFYEYSGNTNREELHWLSKKTVMIRRMKKDVLKDLPKLIRSQIYLETPPSKSNKLKGLFKEWKEINKNMPKMVPASKEIQAAAFRRKSIISELFRKTAEAKLPAVQKLVADLASTGVKFIIFGHHQHFLNGICETLEAGDITHMKIDGATSLKKRDEYVTEFQAGRIQVAVLSLLAASTGLTLTACSTLIFGELYWTSGQLLQGEARINRIGATETSDIRYVIAKDTLDDHMFKMVSFKQENVDRMLDGAKFVEFAGLESMEDTINT